MESLAAEHLTFTYPEAGTPALADVSLTVEEGDFLVLCGYSGCGKSTLLRQFKPALAPHGQRSGVLRLFGQPPETLDDRALAADVAFVGQSPENGTVTDKVWHELAFGAESLGMDTPSIRRRVAEMAAYFGIGDLFHRDTAELSGGQKQTVCLASAMVLRPKLLLLDEPTAQLDPIAARNFLATVRQLNRELGLTVLLADHRLEDALPLANRAVVLDGGRVLVSGTPAEVGAALKTGRHGMYAAMPAAMRVWGALGEQPPCPVSAAEGRVFLRARTAVHPARPPVPVSLPNPARGDVKIEASSLRFRYARNEPDILNDFSLTAYAGELLCLLGGNGSGKTTVQRILAGLCKPYGGTLRVVGRAGYLPQDPQTLFVKKTVRADLTDPLAKSGRPKDEIARDVARVTRICRLSDLVDRHPYDLSGGEQQRAALAKILLERPDILLLDEPTKGMDARFKREFADILCALRSAGACIVLVSHDVEFCARYADRCAMLFDGAVVSEGTPRAFFGDHRFYTTAAAHMAEGILPGVLLTEDIIFALGGALPEQEPRPVPAADAGTAFGQAPPAPKKEKLALWRKIGASLFAAAALVCMLYAARHVDLSEMTGASGVTASGWRQLALYGIFTLLLVLTAVFLFRKSPSRAAPIPSRERRLSKRTVTAAVLIVLTVPLTLFIGLRYFGRQRYLITAFAVLAESMLPFFLVFEGKKPKARELMVVAVLCALAVAGRAAFFMLPEFKPVLAVVVISGVALGPETGFLVGAVTMLVSNMLFSQGPWTPWQMFAMGIIGFSAGFLHRKGLLSASRASLCVFGALSALLIYGGIMNASSALIWSGDTLSTPVFMSYYLTGLPMDCVHAAATAIFLWFLADPMLDQLNRIRVKYGLLA